MFICVEIEISVYLSKMFWQKGRVFNKDTKSVF